MDKATGLHMISNSVLKGAKDIIAPSMADIFNASIERKIFPDDFKTARVTPIFKCGDKEDLGNYRPISIISSIGAKVFEKLLYQQLHEFLSRRKILNMRQWGFRSLHSTALALIDCTPDWLINIDRGMTNIAIFLDIKKAFDMIDHNILLTKLSYYGISDKDLQLFESYLCDRRQCCNIDGHVSSFQTIKYGVPQGSILGPLLFILYMNDLPSCLSNGHMTMYADDTSSSKAVRTLDEIREYVIPSLQKISDWLKANKLGLNAVKTEFMISGSNQRIKMFDELIAIRVDDHLITRTNWTKYLGIIVDDNLSWELQIDHVSKKINQNIDVMKHIKSCVPKESLIMVYRSLVEPYFRY